MATYLTIDLADQNIRVHRLATAGSPRVGDGDFWKCFEKLVTPNTDHFRLVHEKDIVPHVR